MQIAEARVWLERYTAANEAPGLTPDEIDDLLGIGIADPPWRAETRYAVGQAIAVDDARWLVQYGGISGLSAPTFTGTTVNDGSVTWEAGGDPVWDLHAAAYEGWMWIAAKVAGGYDFSMEGGSWSRSQAYDHCLKMAAMHASQSPNPAVGGVRAGMLGSVKAAPPAHPFRVRSGTLVYRRDSIL